jgi:2-haloacid dehalogenase
MPPLPAALSFDVFGTLVDWRASIARAAVPRLAALGRGDLDAHAFADAWRARYRPAMARVLRGERPFVVLDVLHAETLADTLAGFGIAAPADLEDWSRDWHRLDPWPDVPAGLARLREGRPCVTLSNGNVALIVALSRHAGLTWDAVLGAEAARTYKPDPRAYRHAAAALGLRPGELCHVAAHHSDLAAARAAGLLTAHVARPLEYGGRPAPDADQAQDWEWRVADLPALADALAAAAGG